MIDPANLFRPGELRRMAESSRRPLIGLGPNRPRTRKESFHGEELDEEQVQRVHGFGQGEVTDRLFKLFIDRRRLLAGQHEVAGKTMTVILLNSFPSEPCTALISIP